MLHTKLSTARHFQLRESIHDYAVTWPGAPAFAVAPRAAPIAGPIAQTAFVGTAGDDIFVGAGADDTFDMTQGGNDTVKGKAANDSFTFGAAFTANDKIDGGADGGSSTIDYRDKLYLDGDYSAGVVFSATTMSGVEVIYMGDSNDYKFTTHDNTVAPGDVLLVKAISVIGPTSLAFDGSAETDGWFWLVGTSGVDHLTGGALSDTFLFYTGGFSAADRIDGGPGGNSFQLLGDYSAEITFQANTLKNIHQIYIQAGNANLVFHDACLAAGEIMTVIMSSFAVGETLRFDGHSERDGFFQMYGGTSGDVLIGGRQDDYLQGNAGRDTLTGGLDVDTLAYTAASDSTSKHYDTAVGFNFSFDLFDVPVTITGIDGSVNVGSLSSSSFDADMEAVIDATELKANHALRYTPDAGGLAGKLFLIVDLNGTDGYQGGDDLVVLLKNAAHPGAMDIGDFI